MDIRFITQDVAICKWSHKETGEMNGKPNRTGNHLRECLPAGERQMAGGCHEPDARKASSGHAG
jgi:hypothetical protein